MISQCIKNRKELVKNLELAAMRSTCKRRPNGVIQLSHAQQDKSFGSRSTGTIDGAVSSDMEAHLNISVQTTGPKPESRNGSSVL